MHPPEAKKNKIGLFSITTNNILYVVRQNYPTEVLKNFFLVYAKIKQKGVLFMKKNVIIIGLIFAIPLFAYMLLTASNSTTAQTTQNGKPQVIKFTSAMCLDCQTMNKIFKEIMPKYENKITLTEIQVQDKNAFNDEQIKKYDVTLVPTIILLNSNGAQVKRIEGAVSKEEMEKCLQGLK